MYTRQQYLTSLVNHVVDTYIVEKREKSDIWMPVVSSQFHLEYHKQTKRALSYITLHIGKNSMFVSSVFNTITDEGEVRQFDIKIGDLKNYFIIQNDLVENENIKIKRK